MSLHEQQNFLARLYTDAKLRREFLSEPINIGLANNLNKIEINEIAEILPEEINFFAVTLFWKRLREVEKLMPLTKEFLKEDFKDLFREFSQIFNPQTGKKHLEDAIEFGNFLRKSEVSGIAANVAKFEQTKLEFFGFDKRFAICKLDFDFRNIRHKPQNLNLEKRMTIAVWIKIGNKIKHFAF